MPISEAPVPGGFRAWDVIVVPFPYADQLAEKRRPALVVSSQALDEFGLLWVAMITSATNAGWSCDLPIDDLAAAGLPAPSVIRPAKIACIDPARIIRRTGRLPPPLARKVAEMLSGLLAR